MNTGLYFASKRENIYEAIKENKGLCIIYGATVWAEMLLKEGIAADFCCDKRSEDIKNVGGGNTSC